MVKKMSVDLKIYKIGLVYRKRYELEIDLFRLKNQADELSDKIRFIENDLNYLNESIGEMEIDLMNSMSHRRYLKMRFR